MNEHVHCEFIYNSRNTELTIEEWSGKLLNLCTVILTVLNDYNIHGKCL